MRRFTAFLMLFIFLFSAAPPATASSRYGARDAENAMDMAYYLSVLEENGSFQALYDLIHPDARAFIPRDAVVGWYTHEFGPRGPSDAIIRGVEFKGWTWPVTGQYYPYTAEVSFTQYFWDGGANNRLDDVVRLVQDEDGTWRWFFGRSMEFVQRTIDAYVTTYTYSTSEFLNIAASDIDQFWTSIFREAGERYSSPDLVYFSYSTYSACSGELFMAAYCSEDETVYIDELTSRTWAMQFGDFAWVTIVAHEWGHHVTFQFAEAGVISRRDANNPRYLEATADCLAGVYAQDAQVRGLLDEGDVLEAVTIAVASGGGAIHGTGEERMVAFMQGYLNGLVGCGIEL